MNPAAPGISLPADRLPEDTLRKYRNRGLAAGIACLAACGVGAAFDPAQFYRSYLFGFLFWIGMALGSLALIMVNYLSGGAWGVVIRRLLESSTRTLPLLLLLFAPVLLGMRSLYEWADAHHAAADPILQEKSLYLNPAFFIIRAAIYFTAWLVLMAFLNHWSSRQDRRIEPACRRRLEALSGPGLVIYGLTMTFAAIDWAMSLEPHWSSTVYGALLIIGQVLGAFAFTIAMAVLLARHAPLSQAITPARLHDLGKLLLAFVMLWAYVAFSQYLIIWSGNLPEETPYYIRRLHGGWEHVALALIVLHFILPFLLLLSRNVKRDARKLARIAILVVLMRGVDLFWLVAPSEGGSLKFHWMDAAALAGIGGIWLAVYFRQLSRRPALPFYDPQLQEALQHGAH